MNTVDYSIENLFSQNKDPNNLSLNLIAYSYKQYKLYGVYVQDYDLFNFTKMKSNRVISAVKKTQLCLRRHFVRFFLIPSFLNLIPKKFCSDPLSVYLQLFITL